VDNIKMDLREIGWDGMVKGKGKGKDIPVTGHGGP
jgi:hypothetical protein